MFQQERRKRKQEKPGGKEQRGEEEERGEGKSSSDRSPGSDSELDDKMVKAAEERLQAGFTGVLFIREMDLDEVESKAERKKDSKQKELPEKKCKKTWKENKEDHKKKRKVLEEKKSEVGVSSPQKYSPSRPRMLYREGEAQGDVQELQNATSINIPQYMPPPTISNLIPAHRREEILKPLNDSQFGPPKSKLPLRLPPLPQIRKIRTEGVAKKRCFPELQKLPHLHLKTMP